jgi:hypothetical protein
MVGAAGSPLPPLALAVDPAGGCPAGEWPSLDEPDTMALFLTDSLQTR